MRKKPNPPPPPPPPPPRKVRSLFDLGIMCDENGIDPFISRPGAQSFSDFVESKGIPLDAVPRDIVEEWLKLTYDDMATIA